MYCKHCGKEIDDNSSYCKYCGKAQDNRVSTPNGLIDFISKKPILSSYILWVIINIICLWRDEKVGEYYNILYPKFWLGDEEGINDYFDLKYYQITDFMVYTILIPLVIFLGYHYFKKVTSMKYRILWTLWFIFHVVMYNLSNFELDGYFYPFTKATIEEGYEWGKRFINDYPLFYYHAYDLSELVFYTMIIPIAYWGYMYYKDRKKKTY